MTHPRDAASAAAPAHFMPRGARSPPPPCASWPPPTPPPPCAPRCSSYRRAAPSPARPTQQHRRPLAL
eukprot:4030076-Prymnesium_polylepis.1